MPSQIPSQQRTAGLLFSFLLSLFLTSLSPRALAQAPSGVAATYVIDDPQAVDGDIICFESGTGKLVRCREPYQESMFGVFLKKPQVVLRTDPNGQPVIREGKVLVNITTENGPLKPGDYVTSSKTPGKAQKATDLSGYVLGRSLSKVDSGEKQVEVALSIGPTFIVPKANLLDQVGLALTKSVQKPGGAALFIRYVTAGLLAIAITFFAFNNFGKNISKGVEAIGRNPLARREIQIVVFVNIILIAAVSLGGMILSLLIIRI